MVNLPLQLTHDLERLRDDSHSASPDSPISDSPAETEELVAKAIHLYSRLNRQHERWAVSIREGRSPFSLQDGKLWQTTFQKWCDDARQIIRQAKPFETAGQHVDQLDELRNTLTHCDYDGLNIDSLIQSAADLDQGKGIPLTELHDELQRGLGANRQG